MENMSISFDPDQVRHFVRPDLDPKCLQMISLPLAGIVIAMQVHNENSTL